MAAPSQLQFAKSLPYAKPTALSLQCKIVAPALKLAKLRDRVKAGYHTFLCPRSRRPPQFL
jgi:hypothetical protein